MLCSQCGSPVQETDESCSNCGAPLQKRPRLELTASRGLRISQELKAIRIKEQLFPPGERVADRFVLGELVGKGPVGEVYRAHDVEIDADVAIKIFRPELLRNPMDQERFTNVTRRARSLDHPNIVRIHDSGVHKDHPWVSMQYLEGLGLRKVMDLRRTKKEGFELEEVEKVIEQIAVGLAHIEKEFPHGNLKPENIIFLPDLIKITDSFMLAAFTGEGLSPYQKDEQYLAPELLTPSTIPNSRSDVYSVGMMIGELVFGPDHEPGSVTEGSLAAFDSLVTRATAFDPSERHASVAELAEHFAAAVEQASEPRGLGAESSVMPPPPPVAPPSQAKVPPPAPKVPAPSLPAPPAAPTGPATSATEKPSGKKSANKKAKQPGKKAKLPTPSAALADPLSAETPLDIGEPLEDDIRTVELDRDQAGEIQDLLATNQVAREKTPLPPSPRPVKATAVSAPPGKDTGKSPLPIIIVAVVVLAVILGFFLFPRSEPEVVTLGEPRKETRVAEAEKEEPPEEPAPTEAIEPVATALAQLVTSSTQEAASQIEKVLAERAAEEEAAKKEEAVALAAATETPTRTGERAPETQQKTGAAAQPKSTAKAPATEGTSCPSGMVLVRAQSGSFCIDAYEYPGRGRMPRAQVTWFDARRMCQQSDKRLCELSEWRSACGSTYPYGRTFDPDRCNTQDEDGFDRTLANAGEFSRCRSPSGAFDMTGNVHEWVEEQRIAGGGYESGPDVASCRYSSPKAPNSTAPFIGFRCCADPQ